MKEQEDMLTLQETEQLCRSYMDCELSVLEEAELRYFLTQVDYHSPLIDEVRHVMDAETCIPHKPLGKPAHRKKAPLRKWPVYAGIAASVAVVIGIGVSLWLPSSRGSVESSSYYIAYVGGNRLGDEEARVQIEAEMKSADDFIKEMDALEESKQQMIDEFFNP